jgi:hypothetical protein
MFHHITSTIKIERLIYSPIIVETPWCEVFLQPLLTELMSV